MGETIDQLREDLKEAATELVTTLRDSKALPGVSKESRDKIKRELDQLRQLVTTVHEPRIAITGDSTLELTDLLQNLLPIDFADEDVRTLIGRGRWYEYKSESGTMHILDLRLNLETSLKALQFDAPDLIIGAVRSGDEEMTAFVEETRRVVYQTEDEHDRTIPVVVVMVRDETSGNPEDFRTQGAIRTAFADAGLDPDFAPIVSSVREDKLAGELIRLAPDNAQLPLARIIPNISAKEAFADNIVQMATALNTTIASVPIPVADVIPITTVQVLMTGAIAYTSGKPINAKTMTEFMGAIGINVGAGLAMRELVRALVQLIPVAGAFVSASIAASATYTLGKSAKKYFISSDK